VVITGWRLATMAMAAVAGHAITTGPDPDAIAIAK
jgi:hypothetical protein